MAEALTFVCLDPRKTKRAAVQTLLGPLGETRWQKLPRLAMSDYPETAERAETAMLAARSIPAERAKRTAWRRILQWQYNGTRRYFSRYPNHIAVAWNGLNGSRRVFMDAARDAGAKRLFFELGPFPGRITVDPAGVNYANALPRDPATYRDWLAQTGRDPIAWRRLGSGIKQRAPDQPAKPADGLPPLTAPFIFAPLQVPGDSQLRLFGGAFKSVKCFVRALMQAAEHLPDGWHLRLKEHPSTPPFVASILSETSAPIVLDNATDTFEQVAASRGVVTVNSSVGLEAMFFDKPVLTCGQCFWAIDGMAMHAKDTDALGEAMADTANWTYDPNIRNAVMSFLDGVYYPQINPVTDEGTEQVLKRLNSDPGNILAWTPEMAGTK